MPGITITQRYLEQNTFRKAFSKIIREADSYYK